MSLLKYYLRYLIQVPSLYNPAGNPHIFLFSSRRSGSTLVRNLIYSQPGFNYIDQPLDIWQTNPFLHKLPKVDKSQYISLDEAEKKMMFSYLDKIISRKYVVRSQWQFWRPEYKWVWNRYVIKLLNANPLIEEIHNYFEDRISVLYLSRHPIPTALSVIKRGWGTTTEAYLWNRNFKQKYLNYNMIDYSKWVINNGSILEKYVLNWCLENLVPIRLWRKNRWIKTISYERLIRNPELSCQQLCKKLKLVNSNLMIDAIDKPTRTADEESKREIQSQGHDSRLEYWINEVDQNSIKRVEKMLKVFNIDLYQASKVYPESAFD